MTLTESPRLPCPACGFVVLSEGYGSYDICRLCGWEDDSVQLANPCSGGGANHESLAEAQAEALQELPLDVQEHNGYRRSSEWRPLSSGEIASYQASRAIEHWHSSGVTDPKDAYWWQTPRGAQEE